MVSFVAKQVSNCVIVFIGALIVAKRRLDQLVLVMQAVVQIPTTRDAVDAKGTYTVFDIHLNGHYHGSARYSQLLAFHQEVCICYLYAPVNMVCSH